jgi:hypothetical protein
MRTRQLSVWPPIPAEQVPGFPVGEFRYRGDCYMIEDPPRRFFVYDPAQAVVSINGVELRPYQQAALGEVLSSPGLLVGVDR